MWTTPQGGESYKWKERRNASLETLANFNWWSGTNNGTWYGTIFASGTPIGTSVGNISFGGDSTLAGQARATRNITTDQDLRQFNPPSNGGVIPEPSTMLLLGTGLLGLSAFRLRSRKS
jgi:hypothetical protein